MRLRRLLFPPYYQKGYYHCHSRVVDKQFLLTDLVKDEFYKLIKEYAAYCGVIVITHQLMTDHFHLDVEVPLPPKEPLSDEELLKRLSYLTTKTANRDRKKLAKFREKGDHQAAEALRNRLLKQLWDLSQFMKLLLERFTQWYNRTFERCGTLWEGRFKNHLVEGKSSLAKVCAYADLNSFRAGMVDDPIKYRWGGYSRACAGDKEAFQGIKIVVAHILNVNPESLSDEEVIPTYRKYLYLEGEQEEGCDPTKSPSRRGFTREEVAREVARGGQVSIAQLLRCRVKHFTKGLVIGSEAFVREIYDYHLRPLAKRVKKIIARRMTMLGDVELFTLRDCSKDGVV